MWAILSFERNEEEKEKKEEEVREKWDYVDKKRVIETLNEKWVIETLVSKWIRGFDDEKASDWRMRNEIIDERRNYMISFDNKKLDDEFDHLINDLISLITNDIRR